MNQWVLLVYKVPTEPSARRVYVWRKLKKLGAILLHDAVWILPSTERTREQFQWLASEIVEMGGEALLWEAHQLLNRQEEQLVQQFTRQAEDVYQEILDALHHPEADLAGLSRRYQQAKSQDYFGTALEAQVREALLQARGSNNQ